MLLFISRLDIFLWNRVCLKNAFTITKRFFPMRWFTFRLINGYIKHNVEQNLPKIHDFALSNVLRCRNVGYFILPSSSFCLCSTHTFVGHRINIFQPGISHEPILHTRVAFAILLIRRIHLFDNHALHLCVKLVRCHFSSRNPHSVFPIFSCFTQKCIITIPLCFMVLLSA